MAQTQYWFYIGMNTFLSRQVTPITIRSLFSSLPSVLCSRLSVFPILLCLLPFYFLFNLAASSLLCFHFSLASRLSVWSSFSTLLQWLLLIHRFRIFKSSQIYKLSLSVELFTGIEFNCRPKAVMRHTLHKGRTS